MYLQWLYVFALVVYTPVQLHLPPPTGLVFCSILEISGILIGVVYIIRNIL